MTKCKATHYEINRALERGRHASGFQQSGRAHLSEFLDPGTAERLRERLVREDRWNLYACSAGKAWQASPVMRKRYGAVEENQLANFTYTGAREGFAYLYETVVQTNGDDLLSEFGAFAQSAEFLDLVNELTTISEVRHVDLYTTRFGPGHFLLPHTDAKIMLGPNDRRIERRVAFVLNLTRGWKAEWGGLLLFLRPDGQVSEAYVPCFNTLDLFLVPQSHAVSFVCPFAKEARYAVSGWLWS